jgi:hypothetical protein
VPVVLWFRIAPRRLLLYSVVSEAALLTSGVRQQVGSDLVVTLSGQVLDDPHVILLLVESRSRRDIRGSDFEDATPLTLDLGTPILNLLNLDTGGPGMPDIRVEIKNTTVAIGPGLIKKGQTIWVTLLTDGPASLTCPHPPLADVIVKERRPDIRLGLGTTALVTASTPSLIVGEAIADVTAGLISRMGPLFRRSRM